MIWGGTAPFVVFLASGFIGWVHNEHIAPHGLPVPTPPTPTPSALARPLVSWLLSSPVSCVTSDSTWDAVIGTSWFKSRCV